MHIDTDKLTRFEVIDYRKNEFGECGGRTIVYYAKVELSVQDDGKTLKVFIPEKPLDKAVFI